MPPASRPVAHLRAREDTRASYQTSAVLCVADCSWPPSLPSLQRNNQRPRPVRSRVVTGRTPRTLPVLPPLHRRRRTSHAPRSPCPALNRPGRPPARPAGLTLSVSATRPVDGARHRAGHSAGHRHVRDRVCPSRVAHGEGEEDGSRVGPGACVCDLHDGTTPHNPYARRTGCVRTSSVVVGNLDEQLAAWQTI